MRLKLENVYLALCFTLFASLMVWNIDKQMTDIKFRSFRLGCMDNSKLGYETCSHLATLYIQGKLNGKD